ncbi:hypothetical protein PENSPDRAFT_659207 [Peniophora sp. CONT]|nr:hypothetical protein PENSPDRAFT_659207 [Peniophora sp. CONT]
MLAFVALCTYAASVAAVPAWQTFSSRSSIGSLVRDANALEAVGLPFNKRFFLTMDGAPGEPSNSTITEATLEQQPPLYFLSNDKLYQFTNESYILPVSVLNSTESEEDPMPYKLVIGSEREAVQGITWQWRGPNLHADYPATNRSNLGIFYTCKNKHGRYGTYLHLDDGSQLNVKYPRRTPTPHGCYLVKLLDYKSVSDEEEEKKQQAVLASWW